LAYYDGFDWLQQCVLCRKNTNVRSNEALRLCWSKTLDFDRMFACERDWQIELEPVLTCWPLGCPPDLVLLFVLAWPGLAWSVRRLVGATVLFGQHPLIFNWALDQNGLRSMVSSSCYSCS